MEGEGTTGSLVSVNGRFAHLANGHVGRPATRGLPQHPWDILIQKILVVYLQYSLNWVPCILSGNLAVVGSQLERGVTGGGRQIPPGRGEQQADRWGL